MSSRLRAIARDTVEISERGSYSTGSREVPIAVTPAVSGTRLHLPEDELSLPAPGEPPRVDVTNESTLEATRRLGGDVAGLVFASARNPGGGFLNGAQAQEESVARASALYRSYGLSGSVSCSAGRSERCWASWLPAYCPRPGGADRVRGPGLRGRVSSRRRVSGPAWAVRCSA